MKTQPLSVFVFVYAPQQPYERTKDTIYGMQETKPMEWFRRHITGSSSTEKCYRSAFNAFCHWTERNNRVPRTWDDVSMKLVQNFSEHCLRQYSASRYNMLMMVLRHLLIQAYNDVSVPFSNGEILTFLKEQRALTSVQDDGRVALTKEQVEMLYELHTEDRMERLVRDMFVLQCLTSLRISNVSGADFRQHRKEKEFDVIQVKEKGSSNQRVSLYMDTRIGAILERNDWHFPHIMQNTYNRILRQLIKRMPYAKDMVEIKTRRADGSTRIMSKPLFEAIRSHNGRRTFITELRSNPNVQDRDLMVFTGHKSMRMLATYDKTSRTRRAQNVLRAMGRI